MNSKQWWKSRTIWANVIMAIPVILDKLGPNVIPAEYSATIVAIVNVVLRLITTAPVTK